MKPIAIAALLFVPAVLHAATWTVDHNEARPANFRVLQEAVDAAEEGDVILVAASIRGYEEVSLAKRVTIKGPGWDPGRMMIDGDYAAQVSIRALAGSDGSRFEGLSLYLQAPLGETAESPAPNSLVISRCQLEATLYGNGHSISRCYSYRFTQILGNQASVRNSALLDGFYCNGFGVVVDHCVIYIPSAVAIEGGGGFYSFGSGTTLTNSIFTRPYKTTYAAGYIGNCITVAEGELPAGNGNLTVDGVEDLFVGTFGNLSYPSEGDAGLFLKEESPAKGAGTGGSDVGIFGGSTPYIVGGIPAIPRIHLLKLPPVVPDSTGLVFEVEGEARD